MKWVAALQNRRLQMKWDSSILDRVLDYLLQRGLLRRRPKPAEWVDFAALQNRRLQTKWDSSIIDSVLDYLWERGHLRRRPKLAEWEYLHRLVSDQTAATD
jgi:DNA-binding MarR family transcriptional regulator